MSDGPSRQPSYAELLQLLRARRSVRRFREEPLPEATLDQLLEAARWAPSASNRQRFRILVVTSPARIRLLGEAVAQRLARLQQEVRPGREEATAAVREHFLVFTGAPVVLALTHRPGTDLLAGLARRTPPGEVSPAAAPAAGIPRPIVDSLSGVAAAVTQLLLAAQALGLGACWMTGPLVARTELERLLDVRDGWELAALVPVGFPAELPAPPARRPLTQLVRRLP